MRTHRQVAYRRLLWLAIAVAVVGTAIWIYWYAHTFKLGTRFISPQGELLQLHGHGRSLLIPTPLYPSARVITFTCPPTGKDDEHALYLILGTPDDPQVVMDYYLAKWGKHGLHRRNTPTSAKGSAGGDFVTRKIRGTIASVEILRAAVGSRDLTEALREPFRPPRPGDEETKIVLFVPWVAEERR